MVFLDSGSFGFHCGFRQVLDLIGYGFTSVYFKYYMSRLAIPSSMIGMNGQSIHLSFNIYGEFFKAEERKDFSLLDHLVFKGFLALGSGYRHKIYCHPGICNSIYTSEIPKEKFSLLHYRDNLSVTKYKEATFFGLPLI